MSESLRKRGRPMLRRNRIPQSNAEPTQHQQITSSPDPEAVEEPEEGYQTAVTSLAQEIATSSDSVQRNVMVDSPTFEYGNPVTLLDQGNRTMSDIMEIPEPNNDIADDEAIMVDYPRSGNGDHDERFVTLRGDAHGKMPDIMEIPEPNNDIADDEAIMVDLPRGESGDHDDRFVRLLGDAHGKMPDIMEMPESDNETEDCEVVPAKRPRGRPRGRKLVVKSGRGPGRPRKIREN